MKKNIKNVKAHLKKKNKNMFRHINNAMVVYMADFLSQEMVPDTYDYTKLFGLWKGKGSKLDLNMRKYLHKPTYANRGNER